MPIKHDLVTQSQFFAHLKCPERGHFYLEVDGAFISTSMSLSPDPINRPEKITAAIIPAITIRAIAQIMPLGPPEPFSSAIRKTPYGLRLSDYVTADATKVPRPGLLKVWVTGTRLAKEDRTRTISLLFFITLAYNAGIV